jgi:hypothetical protein
VSSAKSDDGSGNLVETLALRLVGLKYTGGAQHLASQPLDAAFLDGNLNGTLTECLLMAVNVICCETAILLESAQSGRARRVLKTPLMTQATI